MILFVAACLGSSFLTSYLAVACLRRWAPRWGLIDHPAARKVHRLPTPLGGGIGIWLGVVLPLAVVQLIVELFRRGVWPSGFAPELLVEYAAGQTTTLPVLVTVIGASSTVAIIGLIDDFRGLPWTFRLGMQFVTAAAVVAADLRFTMFVSAPWVGMLVTAFWIVILVNSFNFLDNMNGLSSGIALIASALLACLMLAALPTPHQFVAGMALLLAGALGGFFVHNWSGRIFMGDAGSYFTGMMIATLTTAATFYEPTVGGRHVIFAPLCLLAVPLYDFASVVTIRLVQGRSPFQPDKSHFSHRLVELGLSSHRAVQTVLLATLTTGLGGWVLYRVDGWGGAILVMLMIGCLLAIIAILETTGRRAARRHQRAALAAIDAAGAAQANRASPGSVDATAIDRLEVANEDLSAAVPSPPFPS